MFTNTELAYQAASDHWLDLTRRTIDPCLVLQARTIMIRTDPLAAVIDQLDRVIALDGDDLAKAVEQLADMTTTATTQRHALPEESSRLIARVGSDARHWSSALDSPTVDPRHILSDIRTEIRKFDTRLWRYQIPQARRLDDAAAPNAIAFLPDRDRMDHPWRIEFIRQGMPAQSTDASSLFGQRIMTETHANRLCNALNRALGLTQADAQRLIGTAAFGNVA